jgi:ABC-type glycerol-3-phosphate transport system substrate-binding protein
MTKRLITLLAALLLLAFAAGCGDDNGSDSSGSDKPAQAESEKDATVESGDAEAPANLDEAIEQCKKSVNQAPNVSDDSKSKLEDICEKAGSGDQEDIEAAAREVCETIVKDSIPEGSPGREAALSACESAGGQQ